MSIKSVCNLVITPNDIMGFDTTEVMATSLVLPADNEVSEFLKRIAKELGIESETSANKILQLYLQDIANKIKLLKQRTNTSIIIYVTHCEQDDPMSSWIDNEDNLQALHTYRFVDVVCGTTQIGGRFAEAIKVLREETRQNLWKSITQNMLAKPVKVKATMNMFKKLWNSVCDFINFADQWKFLTNQFQNFLNYLKSLGVDDETLEEINSALH
ncbi:unnamed protein product [Didymodactylos carnosus]|uniref:Uncharacterized protein n=1 Tax=Didymodactylos carnosus TaxID=1234261 RepID=A0A813NN14_9BILA|nr:unnamed protein product [Didymodactylos carnosus]CAF0796237.1 unnamed protein product [Didymodactylos carnosus]CAF3516142.1 unnamed protein product [Didymodactylos carnosus]CAF3579292.1 unnamed protein product [Didymodactylos carnosus]